MAQRGGWAAMFDATFRASRNAMVLADSHRHILDVNGACLRLLGYSRSEMVGHRMSNFIDGGPLLTPQEWADSLARRHFSGEGNVVTADRSLIAIQWGAVTEQCTGDRLVLLVALNTSRRDERFRRDVDEE